MSDKLTETAFTEKLTQSLMSLLASIPSTKELTSPTPAQRAQELTKAAATKTAAISGGAALVPGPLGLATLLPDLIAVYRIQAQLVADVAAAYGKTATLDETQMLYCLFKHGGAHLFRDVVTRAGERFLVRRASLRTIQQLVNKIGYRVTQKLIGKTVARWIPFIGAAAVGIYAFKDTKKVGAAAMELFGGEAAFAEEAPHSPDLNGGATKPQP